MNEIITKRCTGTCDEIKKINNDNFAWSNKIKQTYQSVCKKCVQKIENKRHQENKDEINKKRRGKYANDENIRQISA